VDLYGKRFPHRAGAVLGCHMGADGMARDGVARSGCSCKACEVTTDLLNLADTFRANSNRAEVLEGSISSLRRARDLRKDLDGAFSRWQVETFGQSMEETRV